MSNSLKKTLSSAYKRICRCVKENKENNDTSVWVLDNFYMIKREFASYRHIRKDLFIEDGFIYPRMYLCLKRFLISNDYAIDENKLKAFLFKENSRLPFYYSELYSIPLLLSASCAEEIGRICVTKDHVSKKRLSNAFSSLKLASETDALDYMFLSDAEKIFISNERSYAFMDERTLYMYRNALAKAASKRKESESKTAVQLSEKAKRERKTIGELLFPPDTPKKRNLYFTVLLLTFSLYLFLFFLLVPFSLITITAVPVLYGLALQSCDLLFSVSSRPPFTPAVDIGVIPEEHAVAVAVTSLLFGKEADEKLFLNLERFYLQSGGEKAGDVYFILLCDLPDGEKEPGESEIETVKNAVSRINSLNEKYKDRFSLLVRKREDKMQNGFYSAHERKRGAVCALVRYIEESGEGDFWVKAGAYEKLKKAKYILTLDSDTNLCLGSVREMLGVIIHPMNRHGLIQPSIGTDLESASENGFTSVISGAGGLELYESAAFDRYQSVFGTGVFCGKGMFKVRDFYEKVIGNVPDGVILSHDMPEGNILGTRLVGRIKLTDSTPKNALSYYKRLHRWIRGDVQNLILLKKRFGGKTGNYKMIENVRRHLTPVLSFIGVALSPLLFEERISVCFTLACLSYMIFPLAVCIVSLPALLYKRGFKRRFFSRVTTSFKQCVYRLVYEISALSYLSFITLDAVIRSVYRLFISKEKLLEWTTAYEADKKIKSGLALHLRRMYFSIVFGIILAVSGMLKTNSLSTVIGALWILFPFLAYALSVKEQTKDSFSAYQKEKLRAQAKEMWLYFKDNVSAKTNFLPPDNVQFSPVSSTAYRTSPTNIGLYLLSAYSMYLFGSLDTNELCAVCEKTTETLEKMEKYKGHLYNWYDIKDLRVIGRRYVSTVDSGNLTVSLLTLKAGLIKTGSEKAMDIADRLDKLIKDTDYTFLYDEKKRLFSLGYDEAKKENDHICYDLMMSEARTVCYYAVAMGTVPYRLWKTLGRTVLSGNGYIGMASWSGSAFEYFMPQIFLPCKKNSFLYESLRFAYDQQKRYSEKRIWGISESAFYSFDSFLNYQYKAHGVPSLALKRYKNAEYVISPYSSYLSLCMKKKSAFYNIASMYRTALSGRYGLFESIDFTSFRGSGGGTVVRSYMAHHVGMSICAAANACFDDALVSLFMSDPNMSAASELLQEKIPVDTEVFKGGAADHRNVPRRYLINGVKSGQSDVRYPETALINKNGMTVVCSSSGHVMLTQNDILINDAVFFRYGLYHTVKVSFVSDGKVYPAYPLCDMSSGAAYSFEYSLSRITYITSGSDFTGTVTFTFSKKSDCFMIYTRCSNDKEASVELSFEPVIDDAASYYAHRSFSSLFISCGYDPSSKTAVYQRNLKDASAEKNFLAIGCADIESYSLQYDTALSLIPGNKPLTDRPAVSPLCTLVTESKKGAVNVFALSFSKNRQSAVSAVKEALREKMVKNRGKYCKYASLRSDVLTSLLFRENVSCPSGTRLSVRTLWKYGISGDLPVLCVDVADENTGKLSEILSVFKDLTFSGVRFDIVIFISEEDGYLKSAAGRIKDTVVKNGCGAFIGMKGGVYIFDRNVSGELYETLLSVSAKVIRVYDLDLPEAEKERIDERLDIEKDVIVPEKEFVPDGAFASYGGSFFGGGFIVDKRKNHSLPFSYILAGRGSGSLITQDSMGFTFFRNSFLDRVTPFSNDVREKMRSESLLCKVSGKIYDLCSVSYAVIYKDGVAEYKGSIDGKDYSLTVFVCEKYPFKLIRFDFDRDCGLIFEIVPCASKGTLLPSSPVVDESISGDNGPVVFYDPFRYEYDDAVFFAGAEKSARPTVDVLSSVVRINASHRKNAGTVFYIGSLTCEKEIPRVSRMIDNGFFFDEKEKAKKFAKSMVPPLELKMKSEAPQLFLPFSAYQAAASRFFARTGFYQSSGAYGFRDQLQDCMCIVYSMPDVVRTHILRCAAHQYTEGCVQHWWHPLSAGGTNPGLKSRCSDDFLFLPYVTADYIKKTGDRSILDIVIPYIESDVLNESERYETPSKSFVRETLLKHCLRALSYGEKLGPHGLVLMGSCDWNDGFSSVGKEGRGESVFSTLFYVHVIRSFMPVLDEYEKDAAKSFFDLAENLEKSFEKHCFNKDRYIRAFYDDGKEMGKSFSDGCMYDLLPQSFAAIAGCKNKERISVSLDSVYEKLYDARLRILKLFDPPFSDRTRYAGYINAYPKGIRENGGQYTHAAVWAAKAMLISGKRDQGLEFMSTLNPVTRCADKALASVYKAEPYFISADIYDAIGANGRAGWSVYTGSASWYYKVFVENVLGIELSEGYKRIAVYPNAEYTAKIKYCDYELTVVAEKSGGSGCMLDGVKTDMPVFIPAGSHILKISFR